MEDFTKEEVEQLMAVFRDQSLELLEGMSQDLLLLEADGGDAEAMTRLRRAVHTIKGDSACVALNGITQVAHRLEDLIDMIRLGNIGFEVVNLVLESLDEIKLAVGAAEVRDITEQTLERLLRSIANVEEACGKKAGKNDAGISTRAVRDDDREAPREAEYNREAKQKRGANFVRIEAARIDALLNLAGEMVITRSVMAQVASELERAFPKNETVTRLSGAST